MIPTLKTGSDPRMRSTLFFAVMLLFFIQLFSIWTESIYRLSLIKLRMGQELSGVLLLALPLLLFLVDEKRERRVLSLAVAVLLGARALCPLLSVRPLIVVAGLGVAAFLTILCYALSERYRAMRGDVGMALGIATLAAIALRSWGSSIDLSMEGSTSAIGWGLLLLATYLFRRVRPIFDAARASNTPNPKQRVSATVGLFANLALVSLCLSSPAVVNAWYGGGAKGYSDTMGVTTLSFAAVVCRLAGGRQGPSKAIVAGWCVLFATALVGGIWLAAPPLPLSPDSGPVVVRGSGGCTALVLLAMLLASPMVMLNVRKAVVLASGTRPRDAVLPVMFGMTFLFVVTLLLIFTNVWGYVPYGPLLRNRFYLPFLLASVVAMFPLLAPRPTRQEAMPPLRAVQVIAIVLASVSIMGIFTHNLRLPSQPTTPDRLTILTYNMQQGSHDNADRNYRKQLALLREINADIIGLQECDTARPSGGSVDCVRYFADGLGYYSYYGPNTVSGTFGAAILSRFPLKNPWSFYTYSDSDEVGTAAAEMDIAGRMIAFFSNHPSGADDVMHAHVDALIAEASKYEHVIAVGDYNFRSDEPFYAKLAAKYLNTAAELGEEDVDAHGGQANLAGQIDHIFVSRGFRVIESHYLEAPESQTDHPAHWSIVEFAAQEK
ncbi:MAG: endonuclease/exonuclease/phosphatase family protein [Candidatus Hydrogenedentes bacterium]|nr:endonuclease/exonuclease/phosphatase family protein [Candidatus Hydrogenedentota bacterium]